MTESKEFSSFVKMKPTDSCNLFSRDHLTSDDCVNRFCPPGASITIENAKRLRALNGVSLKARKLRMGMLDFARYA